jgi:4-hydroxybenzoate polyprenyltransferase
MAEPLRDKVAAWLSLTRVANLPTVWSNLLVGLACGLIGALLSDRSGAVPHDVGALFLFLTVGQWPMFLAGSLFYLGGMVLNDVADRRFDLVHRPDRPLASGRVSLPAARVAVVVCLLGGLLIVSGYGSDAVTVAILLIGAIAAYNLSHKHFAVGVVFMGLCRALLYPLGAAVFLTTEPDVVWLISLPFAVIVGLYVMAVTFVARAEHARRPGRRRWLSLLLIPLVLAPAMYAGLRPEGWAWLWVTVAGVAAIAWLGWCSHHVLGPEPDTPGAVLRWLAGLCLIDAYFLTLLGVPWLTGAALGCFVLTRLLQRRLVGT